MVDSAPILNIGVVGGCFPAVVDSQPRNISLSASGLDLKFKLQQGQPIGAQ